MTEKTLLNTIFLTIGKELKSCRLFRNNTGTGWAGKLVKRVQRGNSFDVQLNDARPIHAGLVNGGSDIIGWKSVEVTNEMVGTKIAVFVAIEAKTGKAKPTGEQTTFIQRVKDAGGIAGVARSVDEAIALLKSG